MQVIGELEGADGWHEVMDMASGQVYFWESVTNGVAWDPPEGSHPRSTSLQQQHDLQAERDTATAAQAAQTVSAPSDPSTSSTAVGNLDADIKRLGRGLVAELAEALLARMGPHAVPDLLRLAIQAEICLQDYQAVARLFKEQQQQEPPEVTLMCFSNDGHAVSIPNLWLASVSPSVSQAMAMQSHNPLVELLQTSRLRCT